MLECKRYDRYTERSGLTVAYGETDAVDGHGPFLDGHVSFGYHARINIISEFVIAAAVSVFDALANGRAVDVALNDMPVKAPVHHHRAFEVDEITGFETSEVRPVESLAYRGYFICAVGMDGHYGETHSVMSHGLVTGCRLSDRSSTVLLERK